MKLSDLIQPLHDKTEAELQEMVRQIRHNRQVLRPAKAAHKERAERKTSTAKLSKVEKLTATMSKDQILALMAQLGGTQNGSGKTEAGEDK